jgi:hypothetical protein
LIDFAKGVNLVSERMAEVPMINNTMPRIIRNIKMILR